MNEPKYQLNMSNEAARRPDATPLPQHYSLGILDVGCGRGQRYCNHVGNQRFRAIVAEHVETYLGARTKLAKTALIVSILEQVKRGNGSSNNTNGLDDNQGRFVKQNEDGSWVELCDSAARDKVSNALRSAVALYKGDGAGQDSNNKTGSTTAIDLKLSQSSSFSECGAPQSLSPTSSPRRKAKSPLQAQACDSKKPRRSSGKLEQATPNGPAATIHVESLRRVEESLQVAAALTKYHQLLASRNTPPTHPGDSDDSADDISTLMMAAAKKKKKNLFHQSPEGTLKRKVSCLSSVSSSEEDESLVLAKKKTRNEASQRHHQVTQFSDHSSSVTPVSTPLALKATMSPTSIRGGVVAPFLPTQPVVTPRESSSGSPKVTRGNQTALSSILPILPNIVPQSLPKAQPPNATSDNAIIADLNAVATLLLIKQSKTTQVA